MSTKIDVVGMLLGPFGGIFALGLGVGGIAGYLFHNRIIMPLRTAREVIPLKGEIARLSAKIEEIQEQYTKAIAELRQDLENERELRRGLSARLGDHIEQDNPPS